LRSRFEFALTRLRRRKGPEARLSFRLLVWQLCDLWRGETGGPVTANPVMLGAYTGRPQSAAGRFVCAAFGNRCRSWRDRDIWRCDQGARSSGAFGQLATCGLCSSAAATHGSADGDCGTARVHAEHGFHVANVDVRRLSYRSAHRHQAEKHRFTAGAPVLDPTCERAMVKLCRATHRVNQGDG